MTIYFLFDVDPSESDSYEPIDEIKSAPVLLWVLHGTSLASTKFAKNENISQQQQTMAYNSCFFPNSVS